MLFLKYCGNTYVSCQLTALVEGNILAGVNQLHVVDMLPLWGRFVNPKSVSCFSLQYFCTHTKRNSYSPCSQREGNDKHLSSTSHYRKVDDVLSIYNLDFENYLGQMYPPEIEIKDTTESNYSAFYLDLLLSIGRDGKLRTSLYDKRDDFNFHITNFPFLSYNIRSSPAYYVFISQLMRYVRACYSYECFILSALRLSFKLPRQGYVKERLKSSKRKFLVCTGILPNNMRSPFPNVTRHSAGWPYTVTPSIDKTLHQFWPCYWSAPT